MFNGQRKYWPLVLSAAFVVSLGCSNPCNDHSVQMEYLLEESRHHLASAEAARAAAEAARAAAESAMKAAEIRAEEALMAQKQAEEAQFRALHLTRELEINRRQLEEAHAKIEQLQTKGVDADSP